MRAPRRLIPTESFSLSLGVGALVPVSLLLACFVLPKEIFLVTLLLTPFICGFSASIAYGSDPPGGTGRSILLGIIGFAVFFLGLFVLGIALGQWGEPIRWVIYMSLMYFFVAPPLVFVPFLISGVGAVVGRQVARAVGR